MTRHLTSCTLILSLLTSTVLLSGCAAVGIATGVGAAAGIASAKEGGIQSEVTDTGIRAQINDLWFRYNIDVFRKLNMTVNQGRVLITGIVQKPEDRVEAVRLAWQPKGVKQVINEIRVGEPGTASSYAKDEWITAQLRTRLIGAKYVQSINYSIDTVQGSVYLMGVARNQAELDRVIRIARGIKGVKEVISYAKLAGEPVTSASAATSATGSYNAATQSAPLPVNVYEDPAGAVGYPGGTAVPASAPPASVESEVLPP